MSRTSGIFGSDGKPSGTAVDMVKAEYGTFDAWDLNFASAVVRLTALARS
jgi:hypothetical protein